MDEKAVSQFRKISFVVFLAATISANVPRALADDADIASINAGEAMGESSANVEQTIEADSGETDGLGDSGGGQFNANYFGIFYGPSLGHPTLYQGTPSGIPDLEKPLLLKNYISLGYNLTNEIAITPTFYWMYLPTLGHQMLIKDPFLRVSHSQIFHNDHWNVYGDVRFHLPVSVESRNSDLRAGFQSFQIVTYDIPESRIALGNYSSVRYNLYGKYGTGNDLELYFGPNVTFQASDKVAVQVLYEMNIAHTFGDKPFAMSRDPVDFEPGVIWDITSRLMFNPYLNVYPEGEVSLRSVGVGMLLSYKLL